MARFLGASACLLALAACTSSPAVAPSFEPDGHPRHAPYAAALRQTSVTLAFSGNRPSCTIDAPAGTAVGTNWWVEVKDCDGISFVEVQYLRTNPAGEILFQPSYVGELLVHDLPPGHDGARVQVSGLAGTGWFQGRP